MKTLPIFTPEEMKTAKLLLATKVATMMGRKLEENDWSEVYCKTKGIPNNNWSNLHIDVDHNGLGIEFKMLRISQLRGQSIKAVCGTTRMHPAATRSIRIDDHSLSADEVMHDVLTQYADLIDLRTRRVMEQSPNGDVDMRFGWLLWEDELKEFLYFEEPMTKPEPHNFYAEWNVTSAKGARKASKSLWIYDKETNKKIYSVTTSAGIKIQPYFDVPAPSDPNLAYFRVQSELFDENTIILWVAANTARLLSERLGSTEKDVVSNAFIEAVNNHKPDVNSPITNEPLAVPIYVDKEAFDLLLSNWVAVNDDHLIQLLIQAIDAL